MNDTVAVAEMLLDGQSPKARIRCKPEAVPAPGRYLQAYLPGSDALLATQVFATAYVSDGFIAASPLPRSWFPGCELEFRGPMGRGFVIGKDCRRVALIAFERDPMRLLALAELALRQDASVALVCADPPSDLDTRLEVHPPRAQEEILMWSDYAAFDVDRESLPRLLSSVTRGGRCVIGGGAKVLVRTPMPCGGLADCGVCLVRTRQGSAFACSEGPVFELELLSFVG